MSQYVTITAVELTLDASQQKTRVDITYNQTVPDSAGVDPENDLVCSLEVSKTGTDFTFTPMIGAGPFNAQNGTGKVATVYAVFQAGEPIYIRALSNGLGETYGTSAGQATGNVVSNVFNAGFGPAA